MTTDTSQLTCFLVDKSDDGTISTSVTNVPLERLPEGDVLVDIEYSSLNYKDALAASGHPGVALCMPLVPGIDAVGTVVESNSDLVQVGEQVVIANAEFGTARWGGWSTLTRVPASWCIALPRELSAKAAMVYGTAGFTAAQSIAQLEQQGIQPDDGEILVTGATGGVGIIAVHMLSQLGYEVTACTGKQEMTDWLKSYGASSVIGREDLEDKSDRPLLKGRWAGAVDTVGGLMLAKVIRSAKPAAAITACGMVGGVDLPTTVYPFILRGVRLCGIDSAGVTRVFRIQIWDRLSEIWSEQLDDLSDIVPLADVSRSVEQILQAKIAGRVVVQP